jgi:hypothetical protein
LQVGCACQIVLFLFEGLQVGCACRITLLHPLLLTLCSLHRPRSRHSHCRCQERANLGRAVLQMAASRLLPFPARGTHTNTHTHAHKHTGPSHTYTQPLTHKDK